jgi:undecaprenyl-diphosphatase
VQLARALLERVTWRALLYWGLLVAFVWLFVELADEVYEEEGFFFDEPILAWFYGLRTAFFDQLAVGLSTLGDVPAVVAVSLVATLLLWRTSRREARFFVFSMAGASLLMLLGKLFFARSRPTLFPEVDLYSVAGASFPSGHATGSVALALTLFLLVRRLAPRWQLPVAVVAFALAFAISLSRLYLQVHYPSDILAGWALGAAWVLGVHHPFTRGRAHALLLVRLPKGLAARLEAAARDMGVDKDALAQEALERYLSEVKGSARARPASARPRE